MFRPPPIFTGWYLVQGPSSVILFLSQVDLVVLCVSSVHNRSYVSKNFERPHYVRFNKKIFDTISINIRDEAGDLVAFEHSKVIITFHFRCSKTVFYI